MTDERTPEEAEKARQELLAKYEDLHTRTVELQEKMAGMQPPNTPKPVRIALMIGGLVGLPVGGYFLLGWVGILAGIVVYVLAMWAALRAHEAQQRKLHPRNYEKGKGYIG